MTTPIQIRRTLQILLATCVALSAAGVRAAERSSGANCKADALENWYCAADPLGSAVVDALGRVVCAPGACVRQQIEDKEDWICSSVSGGKADATPPGPPVCDGGCRSPEATACRKH